MCDNSPDRKQRLDTTVMSQSFECIFLKTRFRNIMRGIWCWILILIYIVAKYSVNLNIRCVVLVAYMIIDERPKHYSRVKTSVLLYSWQSDKIKRKKYRGWPSAEFMNEDTTLALIMRLSLLCKSTFRTRARLWQQLYNNDVSRWPTFHS